MSKTVSLLIPILIISCSIGNNKTAEQDGVTLDTIYADTHNLKDRKYLKGKHPVIKITRTDDSYIVFKIGQPDTVKIQILNFLGYHTEIRNAKNVSINKLNHDLYIFTPLDSMMFVEIWQNYDSGKVILKRFDSNGNSYTSPYDGWRIVGQTNLETE